MFRFLFGTIVSVVLFFNASVLLGSPDTPTSMPITNPVRDVSMLLYQLRSSNPIVKIKALSKLSTYGTHARRAVPILIDLLSDKNRSVRFFSAHALSTIKSDAYTALPALMKLLRANDKTTRRASITAIISIGKMAIPILLQALNDKNQEIQKLAIFAVGEIGVSSKTVIDYLLQILNDSKQDELHLNVVQAFGKLKVVKSYPIAQLLKYLINSSDSDRNEAIARTLGLIGSNHISYIARVLGYNSTTTRYRKRYIKRRYYFGRRGYRYYGRRYRRPSYRYEKVVSSNTFFNLKKSCYLLDALSMMKDRYRYVLGIYSHILIVSTNDEVKRRALKLIGYVFTKLQMSGNQSFYSDVVKHSVLPAMNFTLQSASTSNLNTVITTISLMGSHKKYVLNALFPAMTSNDDDMRKTAYKNLWRIGLPIISYINTIGNAAKKDSELEVRKYATLTLGMLSISQTKTKLYVKNTLLMLLNDSESVVRDTALFSLTLIRRRTGDKNAESLIQQLLSKYSWMFVGLMTIK